MEGCGAAPACAGQGAWWTHKPCGAGSVLEGQAEQASRGACIEALTLLSWTPFWGKSYHFVNLLPIGDWNNEWCLLLSRAWTMGVLKCLFLYIYFFCLSFYKNEGFEASDGSLVLILANITEGTALELRWSMEELDRWVICAAFNAFLICHCNFFSNIF